MKSEMEIITQQTLGLSPAARAMLSEILLECIDYEEDFPVSGRMDD